MAHRLSCSVPSPIRVRTLRLLPRQVNYLPQSHQGSPQLLFLTQTDWIHCVQRPEETAADLASGSDSQNNTAELASEGYCCLCRETRKGNLCTHGRTATASASIHTSKIRALCSTSEEVTSLRICRSPVGCPLDARGAWDLSTSGKLSLVFLPLVCAARPLGRGWNGKAWDNLRTNVNHRTAED